MINNNIRNKPIDCVSGVLIIYMIFTHICQLSFNTGWPIYINSLQIFYCYMFFFFFKSGLYFKYESEKWNNIKKNTKKLLIPYIKYTFYAYILHSILTYYNSNSFNLNLMTIRPLKEILLYGSFSGNLPLWFLLTLFLVKIITNCIYDKFNKYLALIAIFIVISILLYVQNSLYKFIPYTIGSTFIALSIYWGGGNC